MIVFDLRCAGGHVWEAWFGGTADYEGQRARGLVECPMCASTDVGKAAMAPAVPAKGNRAPPAQAPQAAARAELKALRAKVERDCQWVGADFARVARAVHAGDAELPAGKTGLIGQATIAEARALADDGLPVAPLPFRPVQAADA